MNIPKNLKWKKTGKTLGQGGQGQVFEVQDVSSENGLTYAMKVLSSNYSSKAYERFHREIKAVAGLQHPYIIGIVDFSSPDDDFQYYVMELVQGAVPLQTILKSSDNPYLRNPIKSLELFRQICEALLACEESKPCIVHRDLSPANILIVPDGSIKIIDFGLCQIEDAQTITLTDEGVGTINYMAPECESGASGSIGIHSDLYSAGKILWSVVTGNQAFSRERPVFTTKSMSKIFPNQSSSWHLYHIFKNTIRHNPDNRWHSAKEAIAWADRVTGLVRSHFPPLEELNKYCPICGIGNLKNFQGSQNPAGINAMLCDYCGVCLNIKFSTITSNLNKREKLD